MSEPNDTRVNGFLPPILMPAPSAVSITSCLSKSLRPRSTRRSARTRGCTPLGRESYPGQLRARYPFRDVADATPLIAKLRVHKSAVEIAAIQHSTDVSAEAHRAAWKRLAAGQYEYQIAAALLDKFIDEGCQGPAYSPIVGSGPNGAILHYMSNQRRIESGELVVVDAAAQCDGYASDITRTVPVKREVHAAAA